MRQDYAEFEKRRTEIIGISPDSASKLQEHWGKHQIPFPGVPDPDKRLLDSLGQEFRWLKFGRMPGIVIIGADGEIHYTHYGNSPADIPDNAELLSILDQLPLPDGEAGPPNSSTPEPQA